MDYISVKVASEKCGISERRIQKLCEENCIESIERFGRAWMLTSRLMGEQKEKKELQYE